MSIDLEWFPHGAEKTEAEHRLFILPFAGGGASQFTPLREAAPSWLDVQPIQPPGRGNRLFETPFTEMADLVSTCREKMVPLLDRPFSIAGYSMGARIALHLIRLMERAGDQMPRSLLAAAHAAPSLPSRIPMIDELGSDAFWDLISTYEGTPAEILQSTELKGLVEPLLRADFSLARHAAGPSAPLKHVAIHAICGATDQYATPDDVRPWRHETEGHFTLTVVDGGHFFLKSNPEAFFNALFKNINSTCAEN